VSKKRRDNQAKRAPMQWTRKHTIIGAAVAIGSAAIAVVVFTLFVGTSFGEKKRSIADELPALGSELPGDSSPASDALNKPWDQLSQDERDLLRDNVTQAFRDVEFRASNGFVPGVDVKIVGGQTQYSRTYAQLKQPVGKTKFAETLTFYCPADAGNENAYRYVVTPDSTTATTTLQEDGTQPWETIVSHIHWTEDVLDLGFADIGGRRAHGLRMVWAFDTSNNNAPKKADYWFDTENGRLLSRQDFSEGQDTSATRYILQYRHTPPPQLPVDQPQPDCVPELLAKYGANG
jgi:hypothetical protein